MYPKYVPNIMILAQAVCMPNIMILSQAVPQIFVDKDLYWLHA